VLQGANRWDNPIANDVCISMLNCRPNSSSARTSRIDNLSSSVSFPRIGFKIVARVIRGEPSSTALRKCTVMAECSGLPSISLKAKSTVGRIPSAMKRHQNWDEVLDFETFR